MGSADGAFDKDRIPKKAGDPTRREFTYFMLGGARFIYASSARLALIKVMKIAFSACVQKSRSSTAGVILDKIPQGQFFMQPHVAFST